MAQIPPITDAYIDEIVKAPDAYNPTLNKTQGVKLRELLKLMRDRMEQQAGGITVGSELISVTYQELTSFMLSGTLIPGKRYLLTNYKTTWRISDNSIRRADDFEPLILLALTTFKISAEAYSSIYPQDKICYSVGVADSGGDVKPYIYEDWSLQNGLIPETGFIYRRIDSFSNRDINFDFRGFWYNTQIGHSKLNLLDNVTISSRGLSTQYNKQPKILGYLRVSNSIVNIGTGAFGSGQIKSLIPETVDDLKLTMVDSSVEILRTNSIINPISFYRSNIKGMFLRDNMPSFINVENMNVRGNDISVYNSDAFTLLTGDTVKVSVTISNDLILRIAWLGTDIGTGFSGLIMSDYSPISE